MQYSYRLIRSDRKTLSLEITPASELLVRAPRRLPTSEIDRFVESKTAWIEKHLEKSRLRNAAAEAETLTDKQIAELKATAQKILPHKTALYAAMMGLEPASVKITSAKKRLGSCSVKNGICYSYMLMRYPEKAIDYVVVHELAHIRFKNHGWEFYALIEKFMPDYRERLALLKK
jgi:predicted metal-dependent hydrolase